MRSVAADWLRLFGPLLTLAAIGCNIAIMADDAGHGLRGRPRLRWMRAAHPRLLLASVLCLTLALAVLIASAAVEFG